MAETIDYASKLYNALRSSGYSTNEIGSEDIFRANMQDKSKRDALYNYVASRDDFHIGSKEEYDNIFGGPAPAEPKEIKATEQQKEEFAERGAQSVTYQGGKRGVITVGAPVIGGLSANRVLDNTNAMLSANDKLFKPQTKEQQKSAFLRGTTGTSLGFGNTYTSYKGNEYSSKAAADMASVMERKQEREKNNEVTEAQAAAEEEALTGLWEGLAQGTEQGIAGLQYLEGEYAAQVGGTQKEPLSLLQKIVQAEKAGVPEEKILGELRRAYAATADMVETNGRKSGNMSTLLKLGTILGVLPEGSKVVRDYDRFKAMGVDTADLLSIKKYLTKEAGIQKYADVQMAKAAETMAQAKPTEGWAWFGSLVPQMVPTAIGIAATAATKSPQVAKMTARIGMAALSGSAAGQTMYEARQAGASDGEVWAAGGAAFLTEYLTEKLPMDRYLGRLVGKVSGDVVLNPAVEKTVREAVQRIKTKSGAALTFSNEGAMAELNKLVKKANKALGGKLLEKKNIDDFLTDILTEGSSEFAAEFTQTFIPMIYEEPENYPNLTQALANGIEGAKAGVVMGGMLGGASKALEHRQQRSRRKQQGYVDVTEIANEDGTTDVAEVLGTTEDGKVVVLRDGATETIEREQLGEVIRYGFDEFDSGHIIYNIEESRMVGESIKDAAAKADANNMLSIQEEKVRTMLGLDADADVAEVVGDPVAMVRQMMAEGKSDAEVQTILDYANAAAVVDGMVQRVRDDIDSRVAESDAAIDMTANTNGRVVAATTNRGEKVYVVVGNVVNNEHGNIDTANSDQSIVVYNPETGKREMMDSKNLAAVDSDTDVAELKATAADAIREEMATAAAGEIDGVLPMNAGDTYMLLDENGMEHQAQIVGPAEDGSIVVNIDGQQAAMTAEDIQSQNKAYNMQRAQMVADAAEQVRRAENVYNAMDEVMVRNDEGNVVAATITDYNADEDAYTLQLSEGTIDGAAAPKMGRAKMDARVESVNGEYIGEAVMPEVQGNTEDTFTDIKEIEPIPTEKVGGKEVTAYHRVPIDRTMADLHDGSLDFNEIDEFIDANIAESQKAVDAIAKKKPAMSTNKAAYLAEKAKWESAMMDAQSKLDYWNAVKAEEDRIREIPQQETSEEEMQSASIEETIASMFGGDGIKITPESYRKETGAYTTEQRSMTGVIASAKNGGVSIERAAEIIFESGALQELGFRGDETDIRNMVIDIFREGNPRGYKSRTKKANSTSPISEEDMYHLERVADEYGMTAEEYLAYRETFLPRMIEAYGNFDEQSFYTKLAEHYEQTEGYDTTREITEDAGSSDVLQQEQSVHTEGKGTTEDGQQAGAVPVGMRSDDANAVAPTAQGQQRKVYDRPALGPDTNTDTSGVDSGRTDGVTTPAGNSPQTSTDKDTDISETPQSLSEKVAEAEAETETDTTPTEGQAAVPSEAEQKREAILAKVKEWEEKTGVKVEVVERPSQVRSKVVRVAIAAGETVKGWYGNKTKKVFIYLPNMESVDDVTETFVHEVVAHKGLNALLGEKAYNDLCLRVYEDMLTDEQRAQWLDYVGYVPTDAEGKRVLPTQVQKAAAADEYIASLAERTDVEAESLWGKFVDMVREFLAKQGFGLRMSDDALQSLLRQSYRNLHGKAVESASSEAVTDEQSSLRFIGEKGAANLDKAEEATTRLDNLAVAREMEEAKKDALTIKMATGWERGADGKWRYETEDSVVKNIPTEENPEMLLSDVVNTDNDLLSTYPQLANIKVSIIDPSLGQWGAGYGGYYDSEENLIWINPESIGRIESIIAHEVQHAIQNIEGFAEGYHPDAYAFEILRERGFDWADFALDKRGDKIARDLFYIRRQAEDLVADGKYKYIGNALKNVVSTSKWISSDTKDYFNGDNESIVSEAKNATAREFDDLSYLAYGLKEEAYKKYWETAGEVEARNVSKRMDYTPEQRRAELASKTEDVAREDQIFIYDALESANSEIEKQKPFHEMIDDLYGNKDADKSKYAMTYFHVADTPDFMAGIGLNGAEFTIPFKAISSHIGKDSDHYLDADIWHNLPESLHNPFLVTKYGKDGRFRIYTTLMHNGKYVAVGVDVKRINQGRNKPIIEINSIKTVFAKTGKIGENETVVCYDERITPEQEALLSGRNFRQYPTIQELSEGKGTDNSANEQGEEAVSFSKKKKSLVGLHNISEDKLAKAIKQGGLANPSFAVVDIDVQGHEGYGDITLVMPSSLVDGTDVYTGDAWSPTYPPISLRVDESGWGVIDKRLGEIEDDTLRRFIRSSVRNYLDDGGNARLEYVFLKEKGHEAPIEYKAAKGMIGIRGLEVDLGVSDLLQGETSYEAYLAAKPANKRSFNMWRLVNGNAAERKKLIAQIRENRSLNEELGLTEDLAFGDFDLFVQQIKAAQDAEGSVDEFGTTRVASEKVDALGLREEYEAWLSELMEDAGAEEVFFSGFDRDGSRKYLPNTLENVSRHMRTQGMVNAYDNGGLSATRSHLLKRMNTLAAIRKNKDLLKGREKYDEVFKEMEHKLFMVISQLADMQEISSNKFMNIDYAEARLQEAITKRNPISYLNSEYGYQIAKDGEFAQSLDEFIQEVKSMPSKYFEGKFERPVYLNEFAGAVVPKGTRKEIVDALEGSGLAVMEYERGDENSRSKAIEELADEVDEQVMFHRTYHGSGAKFDKFDHAFMGTGEGAQVYGWGTYVTDVEGIGRHYAYVAQKNILAEEIINNMDYIRLMEQNIERGNREIAENEAITSFENPSEKAKIKAKISQRKEYISYAQEEIAKLKERNNFLEKNLGDVIGNRHLYTVEIPDDNGSNYLNWERGERNDGAVERIADGLQQTGFALNPSGNHTTFERDGKRIVLNTSASGADLYAELSDGLGGDKAASEFLNSIGYVGIKYPTEMMSGGNKDGTSNYVIFNEADLEIEESVSFSRRFGGNSGYVGYSMSKRAAQAREEGRFPKTDFKKEYGVSATAFDALVDAGIISDGEWHHTSMYGNRTTFYSWAEDGFADFYAEHKKEIDAAAKGLNADGSSFVEDVPVNPYEEMKYSIPAGYYEFRRQVEQSGLSSELVDAAVDGKFPEVAKASENNRLFHETEGAIFAAKRRNKKAISERLNEIFEDVNFSKEGTSQAELEAVNERFNNALDSFSEENADSIVFDLGTPSDILQAAGVVGKPMKLYGSKVAKKMRRHGFSVSELRDLPRAIANPIAVFNNYNEKGNRSILTELRTEQGNFLVTLSIGKGQDVDFNIVSSVFGKGDNNIINWLNNGYATYINKEKALNYLHLATPIVAASDNQELVSATKVVESFENPQISEEENEDSIRFSIERRVSPIEGYSYEEVIDIVGTEVDEVLSDYEFDNVEVVEIWPNGSRMRGTAREDSDLDVVLFYKGNEKEDSMFNAIHETDISVGGIKIDVNPIQIESEADIVKYKLKSNRYDEEVLQQRLAAAEQKVANAKGVAELADAIAERERIKNETVRFSRGGAPRSSLREEYDRRTRRPTRDNDVSWYSNVGNRLVEAYQDSMHSLKVLQDLVAEETGTPIESFENAYWAENRMSSMNKTQQEAYERDFMKPMHDALMRLQKEGASYQEIVDYLFAKHGLERNQVFAQREGKVRDYSGLSALTGSSSHYTDIAQQMVDDFEAKYETDELWEKINAATKQSLKTEYDAGLMSKETYDYVSTMFEYYIPLRGWSENAASNEYDYIGSGKPKMTSKPKKATGRRSLADDPIATIGHMGGNSIIRANRNKMKQHFLNFALNHETDLLTVTKQWYVFNPISKKWERNTPDIPIDATGDEVADIIRQHEADMKALGAQAKLKKGKEMTGMHITTGELKEHEVRIFQGGTEYVVYINGNPRAAQALNGTLNPDSGNPSFFKRAARNLKDFMSQAFTSWNPAFVIDNFRRDQAWSLAAVATKENAQYLAQFELNNAEVFVTAQMPRLLHAWKKGELDLNDPIQRYFNEFMMNGGETGFTQLHTVNQYKKDIQRMVRKSKGGVLNAMDSMNIFRKSAEGFELWNRMAEDHTRFVTYMTSRQMGRDVARSVWDAKEITVNFNKKGSGEMGAKYMNFAYVFFNASIQGMANFGKVIKNNPKKATAMLGSFCAMGALLPMLNELMLEMMGDDEDKQAYADLPEWVRENNLVFYIPFTKRGFITWPLPHELRPAYKIGMNAYAYFKGEKTGEEALLDVAKGAADMLPLKFDGNDGNLLVNLAPTGLQPFMQVQANVNYFGQNVYREPMFGKKGTPAHMLAYKGTAPLLVKTSAWLNEATGGNDVDKGTISINPDIAEHLLESYLGGTYKFYNQVLKTALMPFNEDLQEVRNVPILNKFYVSSGDERNYNRSSTEVYYAAVEEAENTQRRLREYSYRHGIDQYADLLFELQGSPEMQRMGVANTYKSAISEINRAININKAQENKQKVDTLEAQKRVLIQQAAERLRELEE